MKVSIFQTDVLWDAPQKNLEVALSLAKNEASDSDLIILPEMAFTGFNIKSHKVAVSADGGQIAQAIRDYSKENGQAFMFSSAVKDGDNYYNRLFAILPDGREYRYDKRHLFRMSGEHNYYSAGESRVTFEYKGVRILPQICYDLRFPVFSRNQEDYDMMVYVAQWPEARSYQWSALLKGRAIENRAYVVGCNKAGSDPWLNYSGDSVLLDFMGKPIVEAAPYKEQVITSVIDMDALRSFREAFPANMDADNFSIEL